MTDTSLEIEEYLKQISKIEESLDESLKKEDFDIFSKFLENRYEILKKLEQFKDNPSVKNMTDKILKKDKERSQIINNKIESLKENQLTVQSSKKAMKNGYLKVEESIARHRINKSG